MKNPCRTLKDWRRRGLERARAKGSLHVFWFYLSMGLAWSVFMVAVFTALDFYDERSFNPEHFQTQTLIYFVGGLLFGLVVWVLEEMPGTGRRDMQR
ncbi:MAG: hypothetical protein ACJ74T_09225 [Pyrinomonadaceae bacterium]